MNTTSNQPISPPPAVAGRRASVTPTPIASFVRSRNIVKLWMLRMLVKLGAGNEFAGQSTPGTRGRPPGDLRNLGLAPGDLDSSDAARGQLRQRLESSLKVMEARASRYTWSRIVDANLALLDETFSLTRAEKAIFVLAAALRTDENLLSVAACCKAQVDVTDQLHRILGLPFEQIRHAVSPQGTLRRAGLINVSSGRHPASNLELQRGRLRSLVTTRLKSIDQLFSEILCPARAPLLTPHDYTYLTPGVDFLSDLMLEAARSQRRGVNVLLYGPPGTGKTELTRVVAQQASLPLYDVSCVDEFSSPLNASDRLSSASTAQ